MRKCLCGGVKDCENGDGDEREGGWEAVMEKANTKAMKNKRLCSVFEMAMPKGVKRGENWKRTGWRGFWRLMERVRAEDKGGPYLTGPGLFCTVVNRAKWTQGPWFTVYLGPGPGSEVGLVYHSTPARDWRPLLRKVLDPPLITFVKQKYTI